MKSCTISTKQARFHSQGKIALSPVGLIDDKPFKKSLQTELNQVFNAGKSCTKAAFCQARKKLKVDFFEDFFNTTVTAFYKHQKHQQYKKYRLWACDSTVQILPNNAETRLIGIHKNQFKSVASIKLSVYFDILSKLITQVALFDKRTADLLCCIEEQVKTVPKDVIAIYDRAYGSQILVFLHNQYGSKCVIRLRTDFSNIVKKFMQSVDNEVVVTEPLTEKTYRRLMDLGIRKSGKDLISYKLVKVVLSTGETEVLMTNLDTFTVSEIAHIYKLRWGIETCFDGIKNHQMLGTFSGYSPLAVKQDIWCNVLFYNLHTISSIESVSAAKVISDKRAKNPSKRKKKENQGYQLNRNIGTGLLRQYLPKLFGRVVPDVDKVLLELQGYYLQSLEMIKETHKKRPRKLIRQNDRHHTEKNYKRGF